jgi:two-component system, cell cycle sensor histidine kinase and response regulator CckA
MLEFDPNNGHSNGSNGGLTGKSPASSRETARKYGILVVDDDSGVRSVLNKWLHRQGFDVWLAADGQEALDLFWRHHELIDVVLLDVGMPGLDGPQTASSLLQIKPRMRFCFMSGDPGGYTDQKLRELGALAVIAKPFRLAEAAPMLWELASRADSCPASV